MPVSLLKNYLEQSKKYAGTLVFRGLPDGSWRKLSELVYEITEGRDEDTAIQIDDIAFSEFGISSVPTFVLVKEEDVFASNSSEVKSKEFIKVSGNIGIKRALEMMHEE
jgi:conjugal transfer pilus assembly protein TrbC